MTLIEKLLAMPVYQEADAGGAAAGGEVKPDAGAPPAQGGEEPPAAPPMDRTQPGGGLPDDDDDGDDGYDGIGTGSDDDRKVVIQENWPEDWRTKLAGEDEKLQKRLERFKTPEDLLKSWQSAEQKIRSGEYKKDIADAETDEERAQLREQLGIPEEPTGYKLPETFDALEIEADDPELAEWLTEMHGTNANQAQIETALKAYDKIAVAAQHRQTEADKQFRVEAEDALRAEWGNSFRPKIELMKRAVTDESGPLPREVLDTLFSARDGNGHKVMDNPEVFRYVFDNIVHPHYGEGSLMTGEDRQAQANREEEIRHTMRSDYEKYLKEVQPNGMTMAQEYTQILERKSRTR